MSFERLTLEEKEQIANSVIPFELSFNRRCPGMFATPDPCSGFDESNYRECKFESIETMCQFSVLYRELEDMKKNRKYFTYSEKRNMMIS